MTPQRSNTASEARKSISAPAAAREILGEEAFCRKIALERKRTERSREPFLLMLLEAGHQPVGPKAAQVLDQVIAAMIPATRETDAIGWYKDAASVGVIFTGILNSDRSSALSTILSRVGATLRQQLTLDQVSQISISFHLFPDDWDHDLSGEPENRTLYPDLHREDRGRRLLLGLKRTMDIAGSVLLLILCSPVFAAAAIAVKATSRGPVFFRQARVGQHGRLFTFLKFRSMTAGNDNQTHRDYVTGLINGSSEPVSAPGSSDGVYKLVNDARITPVGRFLRRTSIDELPQLLNVLRGDMSLVGPRPPIPYEVEAYAVWHRRRVLQAKPGITGLWQVTGRSRVSFDEMVRLDLRYAQSWSPWLDVKILLRTPAAIFRGAY